MWLAPGAPAVRHRTTPHDLQQVPSERQAGISWVPSTQCRELGASPASATAPSAAGATAGAGSAGRSPSTRLRCSWSCSAQGHSPIAECLSSCRRSMPAIEGCCPARASPRRRSTLCSAPGAPFCRRRGQVSGQGWEHGSGEPVRACSKPCCQQLSGAGRLTSASERCAEGGLKSLTAVEHTCFYCVLHKVGHRSGHLSLRPGLTWHKQADAGPRAQSGTST